MHVSTNEGVSLLLYMYHVSSVSFPHLPLLHPVSSDSSASHAGLSSVLAGTIVGVMLCVCVLVVVVVMGVICFGVVQTRRCAKSRLKHSDCTCATFSKESGTVFSISCSGLHCYVYLPAIRSVLPSCCLYVTFFPAKVR